MAAVETPATILSTFAWGETSKIARLATRDLGVVSVVARGARRPRSRFGAALQILSEGAATILPARHSDLHTLVAFDVQTVHAALAGSMDRYAVASALGELMLRCAGHGSPETYAFFRRSLDLLEAAPHDAVGVLGLRMLWGLVTHLGFAPGLERCVRDGAAVPPGRAAAFSAALGGVLCETCARGADATRLPASDRRDLAALVTGEDDLPDLGRRHQAAHRRLLDRFIRHHAAEGGELPALAFWAGHAWEVRP
jgi:DNA repair protein RecO (recombination protein O)